MKPSYSRFNQYLIPVSQQRKLLYNLNEQMPVTMRVPATWFDNLNTTSYHDQTMKDVACLLVVRDTLEETMIYNWKLVELSQPDVHYTGFGLDARHLRLDQTAQMYDSGIHRVRVNLVDDVVSEESEEGQSVDQVRERALECRKRLASVEALAVFGLNDPKLLQSQDGKNFPYCDLAGLQQGIDFDKSPRLFWSRTMKKVGFDSWLSRQMRWDYCAPTLRAIMY